MVALGTIGAARAADTTSGKPAATTPRTWTQVTDGTDGRNTDEVGLARTEDGVLHVFWRSRVGPGQEEVRHTPISDEGDVGTSVSAAGPFPSVGNPVAVVTRDGGLRTFFAGLTGSDSALDGVLSSASDEQGEAWTTNPSRVSSTTSAIPEGVGAALAPDGTPAFVYAYSFVLGYHLGLDPATPDVDLIPGNECCAYLPNLAFNDDEGVVAWYSNADTQLGYFVQTVYPELGPATPAPQATTDGKSVVPNQRTPLVTRTGTDEIYLAYCTGYPSCDSIRLWQVGEASAEIAAVGKDIEKVNLASDPDGRLWVMWQDADTGVLHAMRSDEEASAFVGIADFESPSDTQTVWRVAGDATTDQLDVVASLTTADGINAWHTVVLPGLDSEVNRTKKSVTFSVTDSDGPVKGAKVTFNKKTYTTNAKGQVTAPKGKGDASIAKSGYTTDVVTVA